jgi:excisionase family DNA binding protein
LIEVTVKDAVGGARTMIKSKNREEELEPLLLTIAQAAKRLGISRSKLYELFEEGLPVVHIGRSPRIPFRGLLHWIDERTEATFGKSA